MQANCTACGHPKQADNVGMVLFLNCLTPDGTKKHLRGSVYKGALASKEFDAVAEVKSIMLRECERISWTPVAFSEQHPQE